MIRVWRAVSRFHDSKVPLTSEVEVRVFGVLVFRYLAGEE